MVWISNEGVYNMVFHEPQHKETNSLGLLLAKFTGLSHEAFPKIHHLRNPAVFQHFPSGIALGELVVFLIILFLSRFL